MQACSAETRFVMLLMWFSLAAAATGKGQSTAVFLPVCSTGECGYVDKEGRIAIPLRFDEAKDFSEGLAAVRRGIKWGYVNGAGKLAIDLRFDNAGDFSGGLAPVEVGYKWGFVNRTGGMAIEPQFDRADPFAYGYASVEANGKRQWIDSKGRSIPIRFWGPPDFSDGLTPTKVGEKVGYVDSELRTVIPHEFDDGLPFSEGLAPVLRDTWWGYVDKNGSYVIRGDFAAAEGFHDGLAVIGTDLQQKGYINRRGELVVKPRFRAALSFSEGLAAVLYGGRLIRDRTEHTGIRFVGGRWGYIDRSGKLVIRLGSQTDYAGSFTQGLAYVRLKSRAWGYINKAGRYIWKPSH